MNYLLLHESEPYHSACPNDISFDRGVSPIAWLRSFIPFAVGLLPNPGESVSVALFLRVINFHPLLSLQLLLLNCKNACHALVQYLFFFDRLHVGRIGIPGLFSCVLFAPCVFIFGFYVYLFGGGYPSHYRLTRCLAVRRGIYKTFRLLCPAFLTHRNTFFLTFCSSSGLLSSSLAIIFFFIATSQLMPYRLDSRY